MKNVWPFGWFGMTDSQKDDEEADEDVVVEIEAEAGSDPDTENVSDVADTTDADDDTFDYDDFEIEWDYVLDAEEDVEEKKKARKKVIAGLAILGAASLATGFAIRAVIRRSKTC